MQSPGLKDEKKFYENAKTLNLTQEESEAIFFYQERARKAFEQRERAWEYFDGMTFYQDYIRNRQAANSYLRPKKNDDEVRINTGVTEKKIEVIYNELLALNLEPFCRAYDENDSYLKDFGDTWTDVVKRSNEIEKDGELWQDAYLELLTQRGVFIRDTFGENVVRDQRANGKVYQRTLPQAKKVLVSGLKIFLGDIRIPWYRFNEQPYYVEYDSVHWKTAETRFKYRLNEKTGKLEEHPMWKFVTRGKTTTNNLFNFRYGILQDDEVEILTYKSYPDDEIMHIVQGVPMDKPRTKLPWEYRGYDLRMFTLKRMSTDFSYGKPLTASSKTLQALDDESIRLVIRKWRQAIEPSIGIKSGKVFSKDIWSPSARVYGIGKDDIFLLNPDNKGLTQGDTNMLRWIEAKTEEFIGAGNLQAGLDSDGNQTATEIKELQKQFIIQLGLAVLNCMAMHRDMAELRTYTLLEHATQPIEKRLDKVSQQAVDIYRSWTKEDADLGDGRLGRKEIHFMDRDLNTEEKEDLFRYEEDMQDLGKDVRIFTINVKKLLEIPINWYWTVTQSQKDSEDLDKILFRDTLAQAANVSQLSGRPLAGDSIVRDFEQTHKKKNWFQKTPPPAIMTPEQMTGTGQQVETQMKPKQQTPSVNTMSNPKVNV